MYGFIYRIILTFELEMIYLQKLRLFYLMEQQPNTSEQYYQIIENEDSFELRIEWSRIDGWAGVIVGLILTIFVAAILAVQCWPYITGKEKDIIPLLIAATGFVPLILLFSIHIIRGLKNVLNSTTILFSDELIFVRHAPFSFTRTLRIKPNGFYTLRLKHKSLSGPFASLNSYFNFRYSNKYQEVYLLDQDGKEIYLFHDADFGDPVDKASIEFLNKKLHSYLKSKDRTPNAESNVG